MTPPPFEDRFRNSGQSDNGTQNLTGPRQEQASATHGDALGPQQVLLQAKTLMERTAFVGHSFSSDDAEVVGFVKAVLSEMAVRCISGEASEAKSVSEKVKSRINSAEIFVGIFTRREKLEGKDEWSTSSWVIEEKVHAEGLGKKLILLKETGVVQIGGMQGDYEYIEFDRGALHKAAVRLLQTIWSLNPGKISLTRNNPPGMSPELLEAAIAAQPNEPMLRIMLAQQYAGMGRQSASVKELRGVVSQYPGFAAARVELVKALRGLGQFQEAKAEVEQLLRVHPFHGEGYHQKAHILEASGDIDGATNAYQQAIDSEPGKAHHFVCLGKLLFRTAGRDRNRLSDAGAALETAISLGGEKHEADCRPFLRAIENKKKSTAVIKALGINRPAGGKRKNKRR
jgi:hypothetical protein